MAAGRTLIILDEDGTLTRNIPTATGLTVHARTDPQHSGVDAPTLGGTTLDVRDRKQVVALDLAAE